MNVINLIINKKNLYPYLDFPLCRAVTSVGPGGIRPPPSKKFLTPTGIGKIY